VIRAENVSEVDRRWESALRVEPGRYVRVWIADKGMGIPSEHLSRIFDPYFSTKQGATGLGLATTYSIVKNHGGFIAVESQLGAGTTIQMSWPAAGGREVLERPGAVVRAPRRRPRVLLMDDEAQVRMLTTNMLDFLGYDVEVAPGGRAAVKHFKQALAAGRPFDAVLLDLMVRGDIGGIEAMNELAALDPVVKGILISGFGRDRALADCQTYGFKAAIVKPFTLQELHATLHSVIASPSWQVH
jgi:CheY-like chemotaxis protein